MRLTRARIAIAVAGILLAAHAVPARFLAKDASRDADLLQRTSDGIRAAYDRGDVAGSMALHHPAIIKAVGYDRILAGRAAVEADLVRSLADRRTEYVGRTVEDLLFLDDMAIQLTRLDMQQKPSGSGKPKLVRIRTMAVFVRHKESPTGWALIRSIVQPERH